MSTVDVIIPCYCYAHFLKQCVESVLTQTGPGVRVLILDDASPDNTAEVAAELANNDSRVTVRRHSTNMGHIATYNEGIEWVSADYMLLLSADDCLLPGSLQRAVSLMNRNPEVGFVFGNAVDLDERGATLVTDAIPCSKGERILASHDFFELSGARNIVPTPTAVVRTELQKRVGGYRPELPHAGDMEMWLRLAAHASVGFVHEPQAVYRHHGQNMSLSYEARMWLPDLEQRKAALDCLFLYCCHILADPATLRQKMNYLLAADAVSQASKAFNAVEMELCNEISGYALQISPRIAKSLCWVKLICKRNMGLQAWHKLQSLITFVRQAPLH